MFFFKKKKRSQEAILLKRQKIQLKDELQQGEKGREIKTKTRLKELRKDLKQATNLEIEPSSGEASHNPTRKIHSSVKQS